MSAAETLYSHRIPYANVYERERTQPLSLATYRDGALVAPSSGTITIFKPDGTKLVDAGTVVVASSLATFSLTAAVLTSSVPLGEGYLEEWSLLFAGETSARVVRREAAVARRALFPVVTDADLTDDYPDIITQLAGLATNAQTFLDAAWKRIQRKLIGKGVLTYLVMSADAFADWHRELTLYLVFKAMFRASASDRHRELMQHHLQRAEAEAGRLNFTEDADHDGRADNSSRRSAGTVVHMNAAPRVRLARSPKW